MTPVLKQCIATECSQFTEANQSMRILLITKNGEISTPHQGRCIALLSPPLFTCSSIDSCVPIFTTRNKIKLRLFPFCKRYSGTKRLNASGNLNLAKLTIQFCFQLDFSLRLKAEDVIELVT